MNPAHFNITPRTPGPKPFFGDPERDRKLRQLLADRRLTYAEIADHFGVSISLIEKRARQIRAGNN